jgi:signal peptide peptidase SppA
MIPILAQRFLNRPLALQQDHAAVVLEMLRGRADVAPLMPAAIVSAIDVVSRPYEVVNGIAIVPIWGVLVHDACWFWDETAYSRIISTMLEALDDPDVSAIALHVNSPGGEVSGCFDAAEAIFQMRGVKPIWAILDDCAYSAAYALASAADTIIVPRTGGTGSIGVIALRVDVTGMLEQAGMKVTTIKFGSRKDDSYPTTTLSDEALGRMQQQIDVMGEMFVELVARNRKTTPDKIRETEAGTFLGAAGVENGLADMVLAPDAAFVALMESIA